MVSHLRGDLATEVNGDGSRYLTVSWSEFRSLPTKHGGGPSNPDSREAIRAALLLRPGTALRVMPHECAVSEHSWGCAIAIAVRNAGIYRGLRFKIRHHNGALWIGLPPDKAGDEASRRTPMAFWGNKGNKVKDPVCGMEIDRKKAAASVTYGAADYFFCSAGCKSSFARDPVQFTAKSSHSQPQAQAGGHH